MRSWGVTFIIIGVGAFLLPKLGVQFVLISICHPYETHAALGAVAVGAVMALLGKPESPLKG
jgi:hypothetical protein